MCEHIDDKELDGLLTPLLPQVAGGLGVGHPVNGVENGDAREKRMARGMQVALIFGEGRVNNSRQIFGQTIDSFVHNLHLSSHTSLSDPPALERRHRGCFCCGC